MNRPENDLFRDMKSPALPPEIKQKVLDGARRSASRRQSFIDQPFLGRRSLTDRLWENQRLRLAWVALVGLLIGAHLVLAEPWGHPAVVAPGWPIISGDGSNPDLEILLTRHRIRQTMKAYYKALADLEAASSSSSS